MRSQAMSLRLELFVTDMDTSVSFYREVLGFTLVRRDPGYASIRHGDVVLGLGPVDKLPVEEGYFTRPRMAQERGLGVEIVLEVDDVGGAYDNVLACDYPVLEPLEDRPWGLTDFRLADPDGYYLRITSRGRGASDRDEKDG